LRYGRGCHCLCALVSLPDCSDKGTHLGGIFPARTGFDAGGDIHAPRFQYMHSVSDVGGIQSTGDNNFRNSIDGRDQGYSFLPIEGLASATRTPWRTGVQKNSADCLPRSSRTEPSKPCESALFVEEIPRGQNSILFYSARG